MTRCPEAERLGLQARLLCRRPGQPPHSGLGLPVCARVPAACAPPCAAPDQARPAAPSCDAARSALRWQRPRLPRRAECRILHFFQPRLLLGLRCQGRHLPYHPQCHVCCLCHCRQTPHHREASGGLARIPVGWPRRGDVWQEQSATAAASSATRCLACEPSPQWPGGGAAAGPHSSSLSYAAATACGPCSLLPECLQRNA